MNDSQAVNPFLPSYEYVPDGEPHVFGDRVYLYGSHDRFNGKTFCMNDYVCYSAPVTDLTAWRYEGVIFRKSDDRTRGVYGAFKQLYAPDVVRGSDGKYYLYYFRGNRGVIGVAVCDTPAGKYEFYGNVKYADGRLLGENGEKDFFQFDPGVFCDDGKVYLYTGFAPKHANVFTALRSPNKFGAMGCELEADMLTVKLPLKTIAKTVRNSRGTGYEGHEFFEASSMRRFGDKYYFIYSSVNGHELCYAVGDSPLGEFTYKGTLVSIGDVGISDKPLNYLGNTHGSVEKIGDSYYVFYHRQTNRHCYSRQACIEKITMSADGTFTQAEITSCGVGGPLNARGEYGAYIACNLFSKKGVRFYTFKKPKGCHPYFTQSGADREDNPDQYIANFCEGATAGFKYFEFDGNDKISVTIKGSANGVMIVKDGLNGNIVAQIKLSPCKQRTAFTSELKIENGVKPLYFTFKGKGRFEFISIGF